MRAINSRWPAVGPKGLAATVVLVLALAVLRQETVRTAPATSGQWTTIANSMPINPVHVALLNNGKVLIVSGSGNVPTTTVFESAIWDPASPEDPILTQPLTWDMFCNGMVILPDGRAFINSGTLAYDPYKGERRSALYDPATNSFADVGDMAHGRWYPTVTTLGDGRVMTFSGLTETGETNKTVEFFTAGSGWSPEYPAGWTPPLYPRMHLLTDGTVFYSGPSTGSRIFDPSTTTWSEVLANTNYSGTRTYGSSVLLPLTPANGYKPRVMIMGGGNPATSTTEIIDLSAAAPQWQLGPPMSQARIEMNATILPNGKILALGGSKNDEDAETASLNADLYDPNAGETGAFTSAGSNVYPRLYHSNALLLPDATVLLVGGNPHRGSYEPHIEIYSPAYLFNADDSTAARPTIQSLTPGTTLTYGAGFDVQTPNAADISSVVLVRPGAPTHSFDMDQRLVELTFTAGSGVLNVTAPPNSNIAPPGYYMLFILNSAGVPSIATFVRLPVPGVTNQPPTAAIMSPVTNVTIQAGESVSFAGSGSDSDGSVAAYAWTFPGGVPSSSSMQSPGAVSYSTPGTYTASLTTTDDQGLASTPATRAISVPAFSLSAAPNPQSVFVGGSADFTVTLTPGSGFVGNVALSLSGLPSGASAAFTSESVLTSGTATLTVLTTSSTPPGIYSLVITGDAGTFSNTLNVALVVDIDLSLSESTFTIPPGDSGSYTVTVGTGFRGPVRLSVSGLPPFTSAKFNPALIVNSGRSTLTISTNKNAKRGTSRITITGTGSAGVRSATASLTISGGASGGPGGPVGPASPAGPVGPGGPAGPASPGALSGPGTPVTP